MAEFNPTLQSSITPVSPVSQPSGAGTVFSALATGLDFARTVSQRENTSPVDTKDAQEEAAWNALNKDFQRANALEANGNLSGAEKIRRNAIVQGSRYIDKNKLDTFVLGSTGRGLSESLVSEEQVRFNSISGTEEGRRAIAAINPNQFASKEEWQMAVVNKAARSSVIQQRLADNKLSFEEKKPDRIAHYSDSVAEIVDAIRITGENNVLPSIEMIQSKRLQLGQLRRQLITEAGRSNTDIEDIQEELAILDSGLKTLDIYQSLPEDTRKYLSEENMGAFLKSLRKNFSPEGSALIESLITKDPAVLLRSQPDIIKFTDSLLQPKPSLDPAGGKPGGQDLRNFSGKVNQMVGKLGFTDERTRQAWADQAEVFSSRSAKGSLYKPDAARATWTKTNALALYRYSQENPTEGEDLVNSTLESINAQTQAIESHMSSVSSQFKFTFNREGSTVDISEEEIRRGIRRPEIRDQMMAALKAGANKYYNGSVFMMIKDRGQRLDDSFALAKQFAETEGSTSGDTLMGRFGANYRDNVEPYMETLRHLEDVRGILTQGQGYKGDTELKGSQGNDTLDTSFQTLYDMGVDPNELQTILDKESLGGDPLAQNLNSSAVGLFQFTDVALADLGYDRQDILAMSPAEQAEVYKRYLKKWKWKPGIPLGMMQAAPAYASKPDSTVVYKEGSEEWKANPVWRPADGGDITVGSIKDYYEANT